MAEKEIKIGIIGFGRMARVFHLASLRKISGTRVVAVCDTKTRLSTDVKKLGINHFFENYQEMFQKVKLDLVLICTPPWAHLEPAVLAARNDIAVFCEKPMATNLADCDIMIKACQDANVPLYLGFIRRFDPGFERLYKGIRKGELGRVFHMEAIFNYFVPDYFSPPYSTILSTIQRFVKIDIDEMVGTWRIKDKRVQGGIFQDHCPHYADLFRWLLQDDIELISGFSQKIVEARAFEDQACALFRFKKGTTAYLQISLATLPGRAFKEYGIIHGTKASFKFSITSWWFIFPYWMTHFHKNRISKFSIYNYPFNLFRPVLTGTYRNRWMGDRQMRAIISELRGELPEENKPQIANGIDGRKAMEAVIGVYRATEEGRMFRPEELS